MKSFEKFYKEKYIFKIHTFSNSGSTDYGISTVLSNSKELSKTVFNPHKFDKLLFSKQGSELTPIEFSEFKSFLVTEYNSYVIECFDNSKEEKERNDFIKEHEHKLIEIIPFFYVDNYDTYYLNCTDKSILDGNPCYYINTLEDYNNLYKSDKYYLISMVVYNMEYINTF